MMGFQVPEEFQAWVDLAETLSREKFAARAQTIDREARFPFENYEDLRDAGLLALMVPREHGGIGADSLTYAVILSRIAKGCASTGLTFNMHCAIVDFLLQLANPEQQQRYFKTVVDEGAIFASITSEPGSSFRDRAAIRTSIRQEERQVQAQRHQALLLALHRRHLLLHLEPAGRRRGPRPTAS